MRLSISLANVTFLHLTFYCFTLSRILIVYIPSLSCTINLTTTTTIGKGYPNENLNCPIDLLSVNGIPPINKNQTDLCQGEYYTISTNALLDPKAKRFIENLEPVFPEYAKKLSHHFENKITHDGRKGYMKEDIFKKLKNKLKKSPLTVKQGKQKKTAN